MQRSVDEKCFKARSLQGRGHMDEMAEVDIGEKVEITLLRWQNWK